MTIDLPWVYPRCACFPTSCRLCSLEPVFRLLRDARQSTFHPPHVCVPIEILGRPALLQPIVSLTQSLLSASPSTPPA